MDCFVASFLAMTQTNAKISHGQMLLLRRDPLPDRL